MQVKPTSFVLVTMIIVSLLGLELAAQPRNRVRRDRSAQRAVTIPRDVQALRDVAYGTDAAQRYDVYRPRNATSAPVIFMVHGGGWRRGDKGMGGVVQNKIERWTTRGFIVVSANYRMLPEADPLEQARDIARAIASAQRGAAQWGGDASRFILMGHSAGAHLVALLDASPSMAEKLGARRWLGAVLLDGATLDVIETMSGTHMPLHDQAFGTDRAFWRAASPFHALGRDAAPFLAVCSSRRAESCRQAERFAAKAKTLGVRGSVLAVDLSHGEVNQQLGEPGAYTGKVESFMASLDARVAGLLK